MLKLEIIGNLGRDAVTRFTPQGEAVCDFSVAGSNGKKDETLWIKATIWGKRAETLAPYLTKGQKVFIRGPLKQTSYTDKDGNLRTVLEARVDELELLGSRDNDNEAPRAAAASAPAGDDTMPF